MSEESRSGSDSSRLLEELVEYTDEGLFVLDASGRLSFLNSSFADLLEYERAELLDSPATQIFPDDHFEAIEEQVQEFVTTERDRLTRQLAFEQRDGSQLTAEVTLTVRETDTGSYGGVLGTARDVRAHELDRYETIVQAVSDPVCTLARDGRFQYLNRSFETMTGYDRETAAEETLDLIFDEADVDAVQEAISEVHTRWRVTRGTTA